MSDGDFRSSMANAAAANFAREPRERVPLSNGRGESIRGRQNENEEKAGKVEEESEQFVVSYRDRFYDIRGFLRYHPGGKVLNRFRNRSLDKAFSEYPHSKAAYHLFQDFTLNHEEKYQEYENLIDWNAPILQQVGSLGDRYWEWVHLPVNRPVRLFRSSFLESLSITPWYIIPVVWIPVLIYFVYSGFARASDSFIVLGNVLLEALIWYTFGVFLWSVIEYVFHRKLFHFKPPATSRLLISLHFMLHGIHHKAPFDNGRLVFPPVPGLLVVSLLYYIYQTMFPQWVAHFIAAGTATGYLCYDLIHYYLHYGAPKVGSYLYHLKRYHNYHHFLHHDLGFGVSNKLWDYAFGTNICLRKLTKPIEW